MAINDQELEELEKAIEDGLQYIFETLKVTSPDEKLKHYQNVFKFIMEGCPDGDKEELQEMLDLIFAKKIKDVKRESE